MKAIVKGSHLRIFNRQAAKVWLNRSSSAEIVVLVDTSASMGQHDAPGGISRYEAACNQLTTIQGKIPVRWLLSRFLAGLYFALTVCRKI
jgi:hypothetical protein